MLHRRGFLSTTSAATALAIAESRLRARESRATVSFGYGFSLYGMKNLPLKQALQVCAEIGFDCVELPTMPDWPGAPEKLDVDGRKQLRDSLAEHRLRLSAMMENVVLLAEPAVHEKNIERLRMAGFLGYDLSPANPPVIETIMGGRPAEWEEAKSRMVVRLGQWAKVAEEVKTVVAIKAHVAGAAHRPEHIRWLLDQVRSPWLKAVFDFSHFQLRGLDLKQSWEVLAADTVFVHVKDATGDERQFRFALPGEGKIDYVKFLQILHKSGSKADVVVEVSGQIHGRPEYDPLAAAKKSYAALAPAFEQAGVARRR